MNTFRDMIEAGMDETFGNGFDLARSRIEQLLMREAPATYEQLAKQIQALPPTLDGKPKLEAVK